VSDVIVTDTSTSDEDYKRLFGDEWEEAKAKVAEIEAMPFPEDYPFDELLEP
jgi:hypothetical protein